MLEQLAEKDYSFCVIDPEGDYLDAPHAVVVGTQKNPLSLDEVAQALATGSNIVFNLLGVALDERPRFFAEHGAADRAARGCAPGSRTRW